ncbi:helix-turn-helix domain-containing protein [Nocardia sp. CDC159]|uniref:Helix-turn-helix domain-containing protein n=1 Tax=Nocardia pulmonis TaxID=2951408 RepID=A0A9X2EDX8_9NOCA|nr:MULTISPECIES: helix-turn-helix domain-containing protein [Nocardia]MCM6776326.1 helix-turn-helix domain-containing protein [Nocardia pulmonis]MCM6788750.1 helix-turn-helix domain-containing protein [Nocardia sp. CDC159]
MDAVPGYRERPARGLPGAVVWTRAIAAGDDAPVLPDGCMDLLWRGERLFVAGPDTRGHLTAAAAGSVISGIRFFPGTAPALLGVPAHELLNTRTELTELWSVTRVRPLAGIVAGAADPMRGLEEAARRVAADTDPVDARLRRIVRRLSEGASVAETADEVGLGARRLHRMSLAAFGYGPKMLARVLRMQRALALARDGIPFAETAVRAGYADQAHLAREVRSLAGRPLGRLIAGQLSGA